MKPLKIPRKHPRVPVQHLTVQYRKRRVLDFLFSQHTHHKGMLVDVSEGGMRVVVDHPFPVGTPLAIRFQMPDVHGGIPLKGSVKRCRAFREGGKYELGLLLQTGTPSYAKALSRLRKDPMLRQGVL